MIAPFADAGIKNVFNKANTLKKKLAKDVTGNEKKVKKLDGNLFKIIRKLSTLEGERQQTQTDLADRRGFLKVDQGKLTNLDSIIMEFTERIEELV